MLLDKYWNPEQLDMCIQKFKSGQIKFTWKGYSLGAFLNFMSKLIIRSVQQKQTVNY